ncbi:MAG: hypothetical protein CXR30_13745 [Geobacter sp.]|nr:MAG: hypothetical protein CXR30_13745 [Geobacter sp.]
MAVKIFETLLKEKIDIFRQSFCSVSRTLFFDEQTQTLTHPGEFGTYRERLVSEFLRLFVPGRLAVDSGFLINAFDDVSTQCDVVIFDAASTPLMRSEENQRFFPVETVCAVGEVKSILTEAQLKDALEKLSRVKRLRDNNVKNPSLIRRTHEGDYNPQMYPYDQIATFLICEKFDFKTDGLSSKINSWYQNATNARFRHNLILSISDGICLYRDAKEVTMMYPFINGVALKNRFVYPDTNPYVHFKLFCSYMYMVTSNATVLYPEISDYMGDVSGGLQRDQP